MNITEDNHFDWQEGQSKPLPKELKEKLVGLGVDKFSVDWQGGSDEGYGDVSITWKKEPGTSEAYDLLYDWAIEKGWYSGAGCGTDYGDTFMYDLKAGTVEYTEWQMEQSEQSHGVVAKI